VAGSRLGQARQSLLDVICHRAVVNGAGTVPRGLSGSPCVQVEQAGGPIMCVG
jgi:hypothetical protein